MERHTVTIHALRRDQVSLYNIMIVMIAVIHRVIDSHRDRSILHVILC